MRDGFKINKIIDDCRKLAEQGKKNEYLITDDAFTGILKKAYLAGGYDSSKLCSIETIIEGQLRDQETLDHKTILNTMIQLHPEVAESHGLTSKPDNGCRFLFLADILHEGRREYFGIETLKRLQKTMEQRRNMPKQKTGCRGDVVQKLSTPISSGDKSHTNNDQAKHMPDSVKEMKNIIELNPGIDQKTISKKIGYTPETVSRNFNKFLKPEHFYHVRGTSEGSGYFPPKKK